MRVLATMVGALLALSACGSGGEGTTAAGDDAANGEDITSPIGEFLGQDVFFDDSEESRERIVAEERERQENIAACMREQGFDYTPIDPSENFFFEEPGGLEWGSDEWVAKYGFGVTTQWFSQEEVGPNLVGHDYASFEEESSDPNQAVVQDMSSSEQEAWYAALYGDQQGPEFDETMSEEEINEQMEDFDFQPSGCEGEAYAEDGTNAFYQEFSDELESMYERAQTDPRIVAAEQKTSDCVAEQGLEYTSEQDVYSLWEDELSTIEGSVSFPGDDLTEEDFASMSEEELNAIFNQPRELGPEVLETLATIQAEEIELAVAVNECGGGFANQGTLFQEVIAEYEQDFLDQNVDKLADFKVES